jgi:TolB-like protein
MFDAWLTEQRQKVMRRALTIAEALLATASGTMDRIAAAEQLLTIDRTHDGGWGALIRANLDQGNRPAARLAFERYSEALSRMGLAPSSEIAALLRSSRMAQPAAAKSRDPSKEVRLRLLSPRALDDAALGGALPGLVEEITAAVSRFRWITCVTEAPGSTSTEVAWHEPDADYILDSTLQQSGTHIRIIMRLLDPSAGNSVIWAHRFDRESCDALSLQSEVAAQTAAQIDPELLLREGDRRTANELAEATAFELTLRAIPPIYRLEPSGFHAAGELLAAAAALEPGNAAAHAWWAYWHLFLVGQAWATDPLAATLRGGELAERAVILDPGDARALTLVGHVRGFLHKRPEEACALHERALSLNPNLPLAWCFSGLAHCYLGRHDTAIEHILRAQQLSPHDPHAFFFDMALMMPYFLRGDFHRALAVGRRAIELNPGFTSTYKGYLATLGRLGHEQESARVLARLLAIEPGFCVRSALERSPMAIAADLRLYADGLRRAGLPES